MHRLLTEIAATNGPLELLCQVERRWFETERLEDTVRDSSLEAAESILLGPTLSLLSEIVGAPFRIPRDLGEGHIVEDSVELTIAAPVETVTMGAARASGQRCGPVCHRELSLGAKPVGAEN